MDISASSVPLTLARASSDDSPGKASHDSSKADEEFPLAVGNLNIFRHHCLSDLAYMVSDSLRVFCSYINANGSHILPPVSSTCSSPSSCGLNDEHLGLPKQVSRRFQLAQSFVQQGSDLKSKNGTKNVDSQTGSEVEEVILERNSYIQHCRCFLKSYRAKSTPVELGDDSIESYSIGGYSWKAGSLPKSLGSKNLFSVLSELSRENKKTPGIHIKLKGKRLILRLILFNYEPSSKLLLSFFHYVCVSILISVWTL